MENERRQDEQEVGILSNTAATKNKPKGNQKKLPAKVARRSLKDEAYDNILEGVRSGQFLPGTMITEGQLSSKYGLSKAPIRTALTRLVQDGWLEPVSRRGHRVKPLTIADARDLFMTRKLIEPFTARMAAGRIDDAAREVLAAACNPKHKNWKGLDLEPAFFAANKDFHVGIAKASGSIRLTDIVSFLHDEA
ncbi:MAG: GntR family transcriptional regulator, partial [Pseudomonadota bacterium]